MADRDLSTDLSDDTLDSILTLQLLVAWAGEGLCDPKRLDWWKTDLIDEMGGGDLFSRLLPKTHKWASLEAVRKAALHIDQKARAKLANPESQEGCSGAALLAHFGGPPHGYPSDVIKACLVGLLRATKIRIRPEAGPVITSVRDPGAKDMFAGERPLKRADILPPAESTTGRPKPADRSPMS